MSARRLLLPSVLALSAVLAACASAPPSPAAQLRPPEQSDANAFEARAAGTSAYGLYLAGEAALGAGAVNEADLLLGRASVHAPESATVRERAFMAALVAGDVSKAAELAPAEGDASTLALAVMTRAVEDMAEGRGKDAYALLSTPAATGAGAAVTTLLKPWAAAAAGDWKTAIEPPSPKDQGSSLFSALGRAILLEQAGHLDEAGTIYRQLATGGSGLFALAYGGFLERRGRRADALAVYDRALATAPAISALVIARTRAAAAGLPPALPTLRQGAAQGLVGPAAVLLTHQQVEPALALLRLSLRLDPDLGEAWVLVGETLLPHDVEAGREALRHVGPSSPEYATARGDLAASLQQAGDKAGALQIARETVEADPKDPQALMVYADLLRDAERYDEAVEVLGRLIAQDGTGPGAWRYYFLRGAALERQGKWDAAQADLKHAVQLKPDEAEVLNYLGFAWVDRGERLKEGLALIQKAVALDPKSGAIEDSLGWAHYRLGDYADAVSELERAVALDAADPEINDHLGDAYWRTGRKLEAQYQWRQVLTLEPDPKVKARAEAKLASGLGPASAALAQAEHP